MDAMTPSQYKLNWLTTAQVAHTLGENARHVRYLIQSGYLPAKRTGDGPLGALLVHRVDLAEYIASLESR